MSHSKKQSNEERLLREAYFQIVEGYSPVSIGKENAWIKHFNFADQATIDRRFQEAYDNAEKKGLPTSEQALARLLEEGAWTKEEEDEVSGIQKKVDALKEGVPKALNKKTRESLEKSIANFEEELAEKEGKRDSLIHDTCEEIAEKRTNDLVVKLSLCKDRAGVPFFTDEEFDQIERVEIFALIKSYNDAVSNLSLQNIKKIAASDFFGSFFALVEDDPGSFFGKRIPDLTFFQINLLSYARMVSNILKNFDPPDHLRNDTDGLLAFAKTKNAKAKKSEARSRGKGPQGFRGK